jgi:hypothetical protein
MPKLGRDSRGECKLNLVRRAGRYALKLPGEVDVDVTDARGDLSWLIPGRIAAAVVPEPVPRDASPDVAVGESAFFARVRRGLLEPLDATGLPEGSLVRVRAAVATSVPGIAALRKIVAAGGPADLPSDLAERHDHYAHGAKR